MRLFRIDSMEHAIPKRITPYSIPDSETNTPSINIWERLYPVRRRPITLLAPIIRDSVIITHNSELISLTAY